MVIGHEMGKSTLWENSNLKGGKVFYRYFGLTENCRDKRKIKQNKKREINTYNHASRQIVFRGASWIGNLLLSCPSSPNLVICLARLLHSGEPSH